MSLRLPDQSIDEKTRRELGWDDLLGHLAARCHTTRGSEAAHALQPSLDVAWIRARLAEVAEARQLCDAGEPMPLAGATDVEEVLERADKGGVLDGLSLRAVATTLTAGSRLRRHVAARILAVPRLAAKVALLEPLDEVSSPILRALDENSQLRDDASPALGSLRRRVATLHEELGRRCHTLLDEPAIAPHLQDHFYTQREERYVIPVRADARTRVRGIVHGTSGSGQTVFVEPDEVVDLNNRLKLAELEVADEERRILGGLSQHVAASTRAIRINLDVIAALDLVDAAAHLAIDLKGREPEVSEAGASEASIDLRNARHPLMVLAGVPCVTNDFLLGRGHTLIISGPNAGGKTVGLKTVGLLALMARAGLPIPAQEGSSLPLFEVVLTDVGDDQSIERNLSTFSAHVLHLERFLRGAGPGMLLLLDELAVGTDPDQGAALAEAVLEELAARQATVVVTTHYDRLKALGARDPRFANASVGFDLTTLEPTYRLHLGLPGASGAITVARRLGLPTPVCDRATVLLGDHGRVLEELLAQIAAAQRTLDARVQAASDEHARAQAERLRAEELTRQAGERLKQARRGVHDEAVAALRHARHELDAARATLRQARKAASDAGPTKGDGDHLAECAAIEQAGRAVSRAAQDLGAHAPPPEWGPVRAAQPGEVVAGVEVIVPGLGGRGVVTELLAPGKAAVQLGALKTIVGLDDLLIPLGRAVNRAEARPAHFGHAREDLMRVAEANRPAPIARHSSLSIDLRGERVDAALALAEKAIDDALKSGRDAVYLIHGRGTGALRSALREHLTTFPRVASLRPAAPEEGGDGVTIVLLD